jgi:transposase-like protein
MSRLAEVLVASAAQQGVQLTGEGSLLTALTRQVLQAGLEVEMAHHLGYAKGDRLGRALAGSSNIRNGSTPKTVRSEIGEVTIEVARDRKRTFPPQLVAKHQRRMAGFDEAVTSLYAKGMTTSDMVAHLEERRLQGLGLAGHRPAAGGRQGCWPPAVPSPTHEDDEPAALCGSVVSDSHAVKRCESRW